VRSGGRSYPQGAAEGLRAGFLVGFREGFPSRQPLTRGNPARTPRRSRFNPCGIGIPSLSEHPPRPLTYLGL
jgi:hypothetical protein